MGTGQSNTLDGLYRVFTNRGSSHPSPPLQYPQRVPTPEKNQATVQVTLKKSLPGDYID